MPARSEHTPHRTFLCFDGFASRRRGRHDIVYGLPGNQRTGMAHFGSPSRRKIPVHWLKKQSPYHIPDSLKFCPRTN
jgi:hypothetical protein